MSDDKEPVYECKGKGGRYTVVSRAAAAGSLGDFGLLVIYADVRTGHQYVRTVVDFALRMQVIDDGQGAA